MNIGSLWSYYNEFLSSGNQHHDQNSIQRQEEGSFCRRRFDGRSGYCILAYNCLHVIREYRLQGITIDICTYRKNIPVICCPLADKHVEEQRISAISKLVFRYSLSSYTISQ